MYLLVMLCFANTHAVFAIDGVCIPARGSACDRSLMLCCPDDYCSKRLPCVPCARMTCCCGDNCGKPFPRICCVTCCGPDDYCPKPLPCLCWPALPAPLSCGGRTCTQESTNTSHAYFDGSGK